MVEQLQRPSQVSSGFSLSSNSLHSPLLSKMIHGSTPGCMCVCVCEVLFTFKHTHSVHTDRMIQPQIGQSTQSLLLFLPMFCKKMLCSISSFTKWRPQFIEIQLVLVSEVMALPAHAHMDARLSIKKGKKSVPSWILCFQFEDFVHLSLHLSRPVSTSCWRDDIYNERILNRLLWVEDYAFSMVSNG